MIRLFIIAILLSSCSSFTLNDYKLIASSAFRTYPDSIITKEFIDSKEYSFIKVKINRADPVIMSLANIQNDIFTWVSESDEQIITKHGKIIRTRGLDYDFSILDTSSISLKEQEIDLFIQLHNPDALVSQVTSITMQEGNLVNNSKSVLFTENFKTKILNWQGLNYYWKDLELGLVTRSHQHFHPYQPSYEIQFFYKFSE